MPVFQGANTKTKNEKSDLTMKLGDLKLMSVYNGKLLRRIKPEYENGSATLS